MMTLFTNGRFLRSLITSPLLPHFRRSLQTRKPLSTKLNTTPSSRNESSLSTKTSSSTLFLSRWSRNYFWPLPVPSPTMANARLINLRNAHTGRGSYSYNVLDARIGVLFFKKTRHSSTQTTRIILPLGTWLQTILASSTRARRTASCALLTAKGE